MAQVAATGVVINNWDGTPLEEGEPLYMRVGETRTLNFTVVPGNADKNSVRLGMEMTEEDIANESSPITFYGFDITSHEAATRICFVYAKGTNTLLTMVSIVATDYIVAEPLYVEAEEGQVYYTIDPDYRLQFWAESVGQYKSDLTVVTYDIPNYTREYPAPWWYAYRDKITEVDLTNIDTVGNYAFIDLTKISAINITENVRHLGDYVFLGCSNLRAASVSRFTEDFDITTTSGLALITEESDPDYPQRINLIIVLSQSEDALYAYRSEDTEWGWCNVAPFMAYEGDVIWYVGMDETTGDMILDLSSGSGNATMIPDRDDDYPYSWDALGDAVQVLRISGDISYIGNRAFEQLPGLQEIIFTNETDATDSIHAMAFSSDMRCWKFAFGEPQNGAIIPPKIIMGEDGEEFALMYLEGLFSEETVLYVPDSLFEHDGKMVHAVDLYREDPFWGQVFNRIDDHTVTADQVTAQSVVLKWLPQEDAKGYRLTITKPDCGLDKCDTTIIIPATGHQGLVDWERLSPMPQKPSDLPGIAPRAPQSDDGGGGMTLTIDINGGEMHTQDVEVSVSNMAAASTYNFVREVLKDNDMPDPKLAKTGQVETEAQGEGFEDVFVSGEKKIYDILGRPMGTSLETLPDGIYIFDNGGTRSVILLRK